MSFKELMQSAKAKLNKNIESAQNDVLRSMETAYLTEINTLIKELNQCDDADRSKILKQIKETDKVYLEAKGIEISGHVLFSRHGQCSMWGQKKLGLSPNTAISAEAEQSMRASNQSTSALLFYDASNKPPYIAISPMNRALQTAGLLIPEGIKDAEISVEPALAENSNAPSGFDVRSKEDMQKLADQTSFWKSPLKKILFTISLWFFDNKDFEQLYLKRRDAVAKIEVHGNKILGGDEEHPDVRQNLDYQDDKIEDTKALMENADQRDCWFFGHGKNFQTFFSQVLGIESTFDYAETRSVYKVKTNGDTSLFSPPYALLINQETGKIEGKYTATIGQPIVGKKTITPDETSQAHENTPRVSKAMTLLGSPTLEQSDQIVLENGKKKGAEVSITIPEQYAEQTVSETSPLLPIRVN